MNKKCIYTVCIAVVLAVAAPFSFSGEDNGDSVNFTDLIATTSETHLILFGVVNNGFTEEMVSGLKSGVPVDFSFSIELFQKSGKDEEQLTEINFRHTMTYDTLKDSYRVELGEINNKLLQFDNLGEAKKTMSEINGVKVIELTELIPEHSYQLKIRANMFEKTLPLSLHKLLPFLSWWDKETDWHILEFNY